VTVAVTGQVAPAARVPPAKEMMVDDVRVNVPPHCEAVTALKVRPAGRVSVKLRLVIANDGFGLLSVKVNNDVPVTAMGSVVKDLLNLAGWGGKHPVPENKTVSILKTELDVTWELYG